MRDAISLEPGEKPDSAVPRHAHLAIEGEYAERVKGSRFIPGLAIYDVGLFRDQLSAQPGELADFNKRLKALNSLLSDKPDLNTVDKIEIVRYIENTQILRAHAKYLPFRDGNAIVYVTQFNPDASYVNNRELTYVVQGLTNDHRYYLFGTFPVRVAFLPDDSDVSEFEGYKIPTYIPTEEEAQAHWRYIAGIKARLENTSPVKFQPDLREVDRFLSSMRIGMD